MSLKKECIKRQEGVKQILLYPLSYGPIVRLVEPAGLEPATWRLKGDVVPQAFA